MDVGTICDVIIDGGYKSVSVQLPERNVNEACGIICKIQEKLESKGNDCKIYFLGDVTSGDCCVDRIAAKRCNSDLIIHFGHWCHTHYAVNKCYIRHFYPHKPFDLHSIFNHLKEVQNSGTVLLVYDTCFHHLLPDLIKMGEIIANVNVYKCATDISQIEIHEAQFSRISHKNIDKLGVEIMVFLGSSDYIDCNYPLLYKIALELQSKIRLDCIYSNGFVAKKLNLKSKITSKRYALIEKIRGASRIGICTGTASLSFANELRSLLNKIIIAVGKQCYNFIIGKINAEKLENFPSIEVFCLLLCPEQILKYIDEGDISQKVLNRKIVFPFELLVALDVIEWSDEYIFDFLQLLQICQSNAKNDSKSEITNLHSGELAKLQNGVYGTLINNSDRTYKGLEPYYNCQTVPTITPGLYGTATSYKSVGSSDNHTR